MEARIEAVEEELRQEKRKEPSPSSRDGKKAKSTSSGDSASGSLKAKVECKERDSQGGLEVNKVCIPS